MVAFMVFALSLTGFAPLSESSWAKLAIILASIPLVIAYTRKNWPSRFKPDVIPRDVLPM